MELLTPSQVYGDIGVDKEDVRVKGEESKRRIKKISKIFKAFKGRAGIQGESSKIEALLKTDSFQEKTRNKRKTGQTSVKDRDKD